MNELNLYEIQDPEILSNLESTLANFTFNDTFAKKRKFFFKLYTVLFFCGLLSVLVTLLFILNQLVNDITPTLSTFFLLVVGLALAVYFYSARSKLNPKKHVDLTLKELDQLIMVSNCNTFVEDLVINKPIPNKHDYLYLKIMEQFEIIEKFNCSDIIKQALNCGVSKGVARELKNIKTSPFVPKLIIKERIKQLKKIIIALVFLFTCLMSSVYYFDIFQMPAIKYLILAINFCGLLGITFYVYQMLLLLSGEKASTDLNIYNSLAYLGQRSETVYAYLHEVNLEKRCLVERDIRALLLDRHIEANRYGSYQNYMKRKRKRYNS